MNITPTFHTRQAVLTAPIFDATPPLPEDEPFLLSEDDIVASTGEACEFQRKLDASPYLQITGDLSMDAVAACHWVVEARKIIGDQGIRQLLDNISWNEEKINV